MSTASVTLPRWINYGLIPLLNLVVAFLISGFVVWLIGESPLDALSLLIQGALGNGEFIGFTLFYATSFIFTGLSVAVAIHAGLFNIGSEGQAYIGGLGCALVALSLDRYVPCRAYRDRRQPPLRRYGSGRCRRRSTRGDCRWRR